VLIDTHCHIHESDYPLDADEVIKRASENEVNGIICIGTNQENSILAIEFAKKHKGVYATVGIHPHYAKDGIEGLEKIISSNRESIVAIGEIGLDYFYDNSPREDQIKVLRDQIKLAIKYDLPVIFHIREALDDFWPIFDELDSKDYPIRGVMHSFSDTLENMQKILDRGLLISVNGLSTFIKDEAKKAMFLAIPVDKMVLETDAPFLTPVPFRGKVNESAYVKNIAEYHGAIRNIGLDEISSITTNNARDLFNLK